MTDGSMPATPKKRGPNRAKSTGTPTPKRKRATKLAANVAAVDDDDDAEKDAKKIKTDNGEADEAEVKAEMGAEENGDGNEEDEI